MKTTIQIPGRTTLSRTYDIPPETIELPLIAYTRLGPLFWCLLLPLTALFTVGLVLQLGRFPLAAPGMVSFGSALGISLALVVIVPLFNIAWRMVHDAWTLARLVVGPDGLTDERLKIAELAWTDVSHARIIFSRGGIAAVAIKTTRPISVQHSPFRIGALAAKTVTQSGEIIIPAIIALVKAQGGVTSTAHPFTGEAPF